MFLAIVIDLEPNLFRLGPFLITWHGVFSVLGILAAARLGLWLLGKDKVDISHGADGVTWMVVLGLVGARVLYVWENFKFFSGQLIHVFYITEGGISQWGGLFGAILGAYVWARRAHFSFWKVIDAGGPAALIDLQKGDDRSAFLPGLSGIAAVAGYPHITVPAGYIRGLPVGISFVGGAWSEPTLIKLAYAYEQATKHRRPPTFASTANPSQR